ncbi:hypothetical protein, partial [Nocardia paucivorans]|uniref:hypothetical protein n=1 Tax=Nocardia paucivorans TaxID=114259 RepID=UPI0005929792
NRVAQKLTWKLLEVTAGGGTTDLLVPENSSGPLRGLSAVPDTPEVRAFLAELRELGAGSGLSTGRARELVDRAPRVWLAELARGLNSQIERRLGELWFDRGISDRGELA